MEILLKDGVKYLPYKYKDENELEKVVFEHYKDIFGENTILLPKQTIRTLSGIGTVPDAFVLSINQKRWFIIEVELSEHPIYQHIVTQITKFHNAIENPSTQKSIVKAFYGNVKNDPLKNALFQINGITEMYKFISETVESKPDIVILIDKKVSELNDVCNVLPFNYRIIVFRTFYRETIEGLCDHIHLFESLVPVAKEIKPSLPTPSPGRVEIVDLINGGLISSGDKIYRYYKGKRYEAEILNDGRIRLEDGRIVSSLSKAATHISGKSENGWIIWKYRDKNGKEWLMDELRKKLQGG